ncbi:MAG TPA: ATP phosphoribosyltransferase regulatory subunit [Candidatus Dormibacteraeota bacterium]|jgi:ATP phosphoribosyltransferase regulatory subunit|nr:ATP phosphoribosyltransferase regulatory subunit [Candidatus Dormibacteraeota bacterium]
MNETVKQDGPSTDRARAGKPPGFVDLLPGQARFRRGLQQTMLETFESWAYDLVETPAVEELATLELGVQPEMLRRLFKFTDGDGRLLAMVGERTVSVARVAAGQMRQAPLPLRLCYLGPTFQGHPAPGAGRESFQAGAELIGTHSAAADAEVVAMAIRALEACGLDGFQVEVGHVGFFGGLIAGLAPEARGRVLDALAGRDLVLLEQALAETDLGAAEQELMLRFPALRGGTDILDAAGGMVDNPTSATAVAELREVHRLLAEYGVAERVNLDLGAVRDFDYYTGVIFEVFAPGVGAPLAAGGRYDGLLKRFGAPWPATGLVVFVDRVQAVMGRLNGEPTPARILVGYRDDPAPALALAGRLRAEGATVAVEVEGSDKAALVERGRALAATRVLFCDGQGIEELGPR